MSEMTPNDWLWSLHHWNTGRSQLNADEAEAIASAWEADRIQRITDMAYIEAADETIAELRAHIEALEKAARLVYDYERPVGNTRGTNWDILGAALAAQEKKP